MLKRNYLYAPFDIIKVWELPVLPEKIKVELDNGLKADYPVQWNNVSAVGIKGDKEVSVEGDVIVKTYPKPFIEQRDESGIMSEHIWAPELHFIDGKWYIHVAAGERDDVWAIRPYVIERSVENPLTKDWVEKGQVNTEFQSLSLDATTFENNGKRYLVWAQKVDNDTISNLYIGEMENPWTLKNQVLLSTPEYPWENSVFYVNEGAAAITRNGKVFIVFWGNATDHTYAVGYLSADQDSDLLDPVIR